MSQNLHFFKTTMPATRNADYYLGCLDGSIFIDFNRAEDNQIYSVRISFDGYGCCNLDERAKSLSLEDSQKFVEEIEKGSLNQDLIITLVKKLIKANKKLIWNDAIKEYDLIDKK